MIVPQYWAEARVQQLEPRQITVRRSGWSDISQEEAQAHAEARAREALERIASGEALSRREPRVPYNGAEGVPIREEILERHGETIITRNVYGARCLNTPDVAFADVDQNTQWPARAEHSSHPDAPRLRTQPRAKTVLRPAHRRVLRVCANGGEKLLDLRAPRIEYRVHHQQPESRRRAIEPDAPVRMCLAETIDPPLRNSRLASAQSESHPVGRSRNDGRGHQRQRRIQHPLRLPGLPSQP